MSSYHIRHGSEFFSKRLIVLIAVLAFHVLIAGVFISGLDDKPLGGTSRRGKVLPISVVPSDQGQFVQI